MLSQLVIVNTLTFDTGGEMFLNWLLVKPSAQENVRSVLQAPIYIQFLAIAYAPRAADIFAPVITPPVAVGACKHRGSSSYS